jgi:hypothetical protein
MEYRLRLQTQAKLALQLGVLFFYLLNSYKSVRINFYFSKP